MHHGGAIVFVTSKINCLCQPGSAVFEPEKTVPSPYITSTLSFVHKRFRISDRKVHKQCNMDGCSKEIPVSLICYNS